MHEFDFHEPETVEEVLSALSDLGDDACVMAGGTALILAMRQRMLVPEAVVSLARTEALRGIAETADGGLRIGALTRHSELARNRIVSSRFPMLAGMAAKLANPQVRNQGTLGGNLCYADPATDPPAAFIAYDAQIEIVGPDGARLLPIEDFERITSQPHWMTAKSSPPSIFRLCRRIQRLFTVGTCAPAPNTGRLRTSV